MGSINLQLAVGGPEEDKGCYGRDMLGGVWPCTLGEQECGFRLLAAAGRE